MALSEKEALAFQSRDQLERTDPEIERLIIEAIRRMSPAEKMGRISSLNQTLELLALSGIRARYPEADEWECKLRAASRRVPPELLKKAFGWDVEEKGY